MNMKIMKQNRIKHNMKPMHMAGDHPLDFTPYRCLVAQRGQLDAEELQGQLPASRLLTSLVARWWARSWWARLPCFP